jgi:hypothetical protein
MNTRIPDDAFDFYVSLGADRTYEAVAAHFGVSHSGIKKAARRENWQDRIADIEAEVQGRINKRFADEAEEMRDRHLKTVRAMMGRALKGIQQFPLANGMEAIRAAELTIRLERLIMGEVSERTEVRAEDVIRQEMKRWLVPVGAEVDFAEEFEGSLKRGSRPDFRVKCRGHGSARVDEPRAAAEPLGMLLLQGDSLTPVDHKAGPGAHVREHRFAQAFRAQVFR